MAKTRARIPSSALKGGYSKRMIKSHPSFELTKRNNKDLAENSCNDGR
jgi:hypothetical protein